MGGEIAHSIGRVAARKRVSGGLFTLSGFSVVLYHPRVHVGHVGFPRKTSAICEKIHERSIKGGHSDTDARHVPPIPLWRFYLRYKVIGRGMGPMSDYNL